MLCMCLLWYCIIRVYEGTLKVVLVLKSQITISSFTIMDHSELSEL